MMRAIQKPLPASSGFFDWFSCGGAFVIETLQEIEAPCSNNV